MKIQHAIFQSGPRSTLCDGYWKQDEMMERKVSLFGRILPIISFPLPVGCRKFSRYPD
jgi:hypothetical protein